MKNILCYGDSNTYGQNPEFSVDATKPLRHPYDVRWTGVLQRMLGSGYRVIEEGLPGRTTALDNPYEPHTNWAKTLPSILMSHSPVDLLVIMLGTNDLRPLFSPIPFNVAKSMELLVNVAMNPAWNLCGNNMQILLVSPPRLKFLGKASPWPGLFDDASAELSLRIPDLYGQVAERHGLEFFDAAEVVEPSDLDGLHMDPENHGKLAAALANKVKTIL
jgi:lysophospholipase L1-like esterase